MSSYRWCYYLSDDEEYYGGEGCVPIIDDISSICSDEDNDGFEDDVISDPNNDNYNIDPTGDDWNVTTNILGTENSYWWSLTIIIESISLLINADRILEQHW